MRYLCCVVAILIALSYGGVIEVRLYTYEAKIKFNLKLVSYQNNI